MNKHISVLRTAGFIMAMLLVDMSLGVEPACAEDWRRIISLAGAWKFEIGDNPQYSARDYNDSKWEEVRAPDAWENQGFPGYDGYAWYRRSFRTPAEAQDYLLYLQLGSIDDVDETFLNGKLIGYQGRMPPNYETAYNFSRRYLIPPEFLDPSGENLIAIRVYDDEIAGGITHGDLGIFYTPDQMEVAMPLNGPWKLKMEDERNFAQPDWDDSDWQQVAVPSFWDSYGYKDYDGAGWYRTRFRLPRNLADEKLILFLGRIDDVDQVYLNGKLLGKTGPWPERDNVGNLYGDYYVQVRAYFIPKNMLSPDQENVLAVRVFDVMLHGGIWDGPVGLATRRQYMIWQDRNSSPKDFLWRLFK
jgi:sialate O-acetylesterase